MKTRRNSVFRNSGSLNTINVGHRRRESKIGTNGAELINLDDTGRPFNTA